MAIYDNILAHLIMLADRGRTEAYREAIGQVVRAGDVVIDCGTGTGVLAIFAERAGAGRVYAIEKSRIVDAARQIFAANGCQRIQALHGDASTIELPEPVDLIVSEWMGHFLFDDELLEPLVRLRDSYLRPGGRMLPERCSVHAGLVIDPRRHGELALLRSRPYGIEFGPIADWPFAQVDVLEIRRDQLLPETACLAELDMRTVSRMPDRLIGTLVSGRDCECYGLCGWFDAQLTASIALSTSPFAPWTHWKKYHFPFEQPLAIRAGATVEIEIGILRHPRRTSYTWSVQHGDERRQGDNVLIDAWLAR
jgi:SAM-dependent methyltransferase